MTSWKGLLAAEWIKLRHLIAMRAVVVALILAPGVVILCLSLIAADISDVVEAPGQVVLGTVVLVAAVGTVVLTAASVGREYDGGTLRIVLSTGADRLGLLVAKACVLVAGVTGASLLAALLGAVGATFAGWAPSPRDVSDVLLRTLALVPLGCLAYLGLTMIGAIVGRSTATGLLAGLLVFLGDFLLSTLRSTFRLSDWLPVSSLLSLLGGVFTALLPPGRERTVTDAAMYLSVSGTALLLVAAWLLHRQDTTG